MKTTLHRIHKRTKSAFTLVEVLVALVLLSIISAVLSRVLQGSLRAKQLQQDQITSLNQRKETLSLQFSGELDEPVVTLEKLEEDE